MKRLLSAALAIAALLVPLGVVGAPSATAGSGVRGPLTVSAPAAQLLGTGCRDYAVTFAVAVAPERSWSLELEAENLTFPDADLVGDFAFGTGPVTRQTVTAMICDSLDGPGLYRFTGTLELDPVYDDESDEVQPAAVHRAGVKSMLVVRTKTHLVTSHKKFSKKYASKARPHTYTLAGYVGVVGHPGSCLVDGRRASIQIQFKASGSSSFKNVKRVSVRESPEAVQCLYRTTLTITRKGAVRVKYLNEPYSKASVSRTLALR